MLQQEADDAIATTSNTHFVVCELEDIAHPPGEGVGQVHRHAQHPGDHPRRDLLRVLGGGVGGSSIDEAGDQFAAQLASHRLVLVDLGVREPREQESSLPGVVGRIGVDRGQRHLDGCRRALSGGETEHADIARAVGGDVVRHGEHVGIPGGHP